MKRVVAIVDTGPIVAILNGNDRHHSWARDRLGGFPTPLVTCEAVLTESCFLVSRLGGSAKLVLDLVDRGFLSIGLQIASEAAIIGRLIERYANVPMSFADACLVRMSELVPAAVVLTVDSDFRVYRRHGRQVVPTMMPAGV